MTVLMSAAAWAEPASPEDLEQIDSLKNTAINLFNRKEYKKAVPLLKRILEMDPEDRVAERYMVIFNRQVIEPYCKQAADAYLASDYPSAITYWEEILKINPDDKRAMDLIGDTIVVSDEELIKSFYASATTLLDEGRLSLAVSELEKILEIRPNDSRAMELLNAAHRTISDSAIKGHYDKADQHMEDKQYDLAIEEWNKVLEIDPNQEVASRLIASVHRKKLDEVYIEAEKLYQIGDYITSRERYSRILSENPTDQKTKTMINRLSSTIKVVSQVMGEGQVWDLIRKGLYHHISNDGNPRVAIAAARYAVQLEPENTLVLTVKDFIESEYISVVRSMESPVKDMDIIEQYLFAALNHIYEGRYDLTIQECNLVLELEPKNVLALKRLGSAHFAMGRKDKAREAWEMALAISPKDSELKGFIKRTR
jgi:tetratricopeptide (TPR) repeat protein